MHISSDAGPESLERIFLLHGLARALARGDGKRPPLPLNIIRHVMRLAECIVPAPDLCLHTEQHTVVTSIGAQASTRWLVSPPMSALTMGRVAQLRLDTVSKDQGWADEGIKQSWSWFDVAIHSPADHLTTEVGRRKIAVRSHVNNIASENFTHLSGALITADHFFWSHLKVGDIIVVHVCAKYPGWSNEAIQGWLRVWKWFEPTLLD